MVEFDVSHYGVSHHSQLKAASFFSCVCAALQQHRVFCHDVARQSDLSPAIELDTNLSIQEGLRNLLFGNFIAFLSFFFFNPTAAMAHSQ